MRELIHRYLEKRLSRRGFVRSMVNWGFSSAAATAILESLTPMAEAESLDAAAADPANANMVEGTGGELLVAQLHAAGVRFVFNCNASGTHAIFDALVDRRDMQVIQIAQEGQMIAVAHGYSLASGQMAFTVNGSVGFPNTLNNMYNAWKDRVPLVVASQRVSVNEQGGRDAFEEWDDYLGPSVSFTRWRWSVDRARRIPEITRRAFKIATTPPEGPVALAFPYDVLTAKVVKAAIVERDKFLQRPRVRPSTGLVQDAAKLLVEAKRPVLLVGPEVTRSRGNRQVVALAEQLSLPTLQAERLFDDFPTDHPLFLGDHKARLDAGTDVVLAIGSKMPWQDEMIPAGCKVIHVSIDAELIGRVVPAEVGMVADAKEAAVDLSAAIEAMASKRQLEAVRQARYDATKQITQRLRLQRMSAAQARWNSDPLSWERVGGELNQLLDADAIIVPELAENSWLGFAENAALAQITFAPGGRNKIGRTTGSALGWGVGAAIGVKLAQPDRQVVALQGDGGFLFGQAEAVWTMARYEVPVIVVVFNNRSYNGPRNKILREGGRQAQTGKDMTCYLGSPDVDFAKIAAGFGVSAETVTNAEQVRPAIQRAIASTRAGKPYLIDAVVGRTGLGADSTWYPKYSVAAVRARKV